MPPPEPPPVDPTIPDQPEGNDNVLNNLQDYIAQNVFNYASYDQATKQGKANTRVWLRDFFELAGSAGQIVDNLKKNPNFLTLQQERILKVLASDPGLQEEFVSNYVDAIDYKGSVFNLGADEDNNRIKLKGYALEALITEYKNYAAAKKQRLETPVEIYDIITDKIKELGSGFTPYFEHLDTFKKIQDHFSIRSGGKFRTDTAPATISRFQLRIGASTFFVPPTSINVFQGFTAGSVTGGALRQPNSAKMNLGHSQTTINMTLYFPNHETIWGFSGDTGNELDIFNWDPYPSSDPDTFKIDGQKQAQAQGSVVPDSVIDRYMSSLRGLITEFKYSPILPIKNEYLNRTFGIDAVTMNSMTVSTVENFPFVLQVNLELSKFNYAPFLPMISDFDQAIHWGKFRQYMGRAAARLDAKVNQGFLVERTAGTDVLPPLFEGDLIPKFDKIRDIGGLLDGRGFEFYYPISDPARIFAPDTTDFRQPGEDLAIGEDEWDFILSSIGLDIVQPPNFNFFDYDRAFKGSKYRNERKVLQQWLAANNLADWILMKEDKLNLFIEAQIEAGKKTGAITDSNEEQVRFNLRIEWFNMVYERVITNGPALEAIRKNRLDSTIEYTINEWNVPMEKMALDWSNCIVTGVSVSLANRFAKLQVQLQDEPTYQHIGGGDSTVDISMVIIGEDNLIRFKRLFEHINGLARIEQIHGVLGFLGVKNVITSLCGIKYVLPNGWEIDTVPNYPHVYSVKMSFIDFDIMQQERENLSSDQQQELKETFGKRNPFLRLKQHWTAFNAYPDFPLDVKDSQGKLIGHLDPDWYFRSFTTVNDSDKDLFQWQLDPKITELISTITTLQFAIQDNPNSPGVPQSYEAIQRLTETLKKTLEENKFKLPTQWLIDDKTGQLTRVIDPTDSSKKMPEPEMIQYLGVFNENQDRAGFLAFFEGGYVAAGTENIRTHEKEYSLGMSFFAEDLASSNVGSVQSSSGLTPLGQYQKEYIDGATNPNAQYQSIMMDYAYRSMRGRMLRAFPTYMLWLIDEGGRFAGLKLFDNFYGLNSVIDFSVVQSENPLEDTLVLRLSNIYNKLTTPYKNDIINEDDPIFQTAIGQWIAISQNRARNLESGLTDELIKLNNIRLKPGVRIHLRAGYSANPNSLQTIFNGVITEVEPGDIMTIIAQSDAVELSGMVNTVNSKGSSGKLDGGINTGFWLSEPRDLIVRLLTMGSSNFKEWFAWGSKGVFFSESRFGIRHFGNILYEPMSPTEVNGQGEQLRNVASAVYSSETTSSSDLTGILGQYTSRLGDVTKSANLSTVFNANLLTIGKLLWLNSFTKRDFEIFKRNIYPGNGTGVAQYMGGDMIDAGITVSTAITYYDTPGETTAVIKGIKPDIDSNNELAEDNKNSLDNASDSNEVQVEKIYDAFYQTNDYLSEDTLKEFLSTAYENNADIQVDDIDGGISGVLSDGLIQAVLAPFKVVKWTGDTIDEFLDDTNIGWASWFAKGLLPGGPILQAVGATDTVTGLIGGIARLFKGGSALGSAIGLSSAMVDDDLKGFDEVSFRAQTYMKTVWDLFEVCAALLPNYIIAVRPFEDRSTVFYGKPHWLYTSGVIPVTLGVPKDEDTAPFIEAADRALSDLLDKAAKENADQFSRMMGVVDATDELKDIMSYAVNKDFNPYSVPGSSMLPGYQYSTKEQIDEIIKKARDQEDKEDRINTLVVFDAASDAGLDWTSVPVEKIEDILLNTSDWASEDGQSNSNDQTYSLYGAKLKSNWTSDLDDIQVDYDKVVQFYKDIITNLKGRVFEENREPANFIDTDDYKNFIKSLPNDARSAAEAFAERDPITFAYQFGWLIETVPVMISTSDGYGLDKIGDLAQKLFNESYYPDSKKLTNTRSYKEGIDIWQTLRSARGKVAEYKYIDERQDSLEFMETNWPTGDTVRGIYDRYFPTPEQQKRFPEVWDLFVKFLWQDPYNRAWVITTAEKLPTDDIPTPGSDNSNRWLFGRLHSAWEIFIKSKDIEITEDQTVISRATRSWMENNSDPGSDQNTNIGKFAETVTTWFDENIGQVIGLITDTLTGFLASIRMSLTQLGNGLSQAGDFQRQANILNASLNDSIYYQMGDNPQDILRLVDNPFTREYGEPVIEIREPFQRIHFASSFDNILTNGIKENLNNVATVVTAVSDGKYPVTVHFDKGVSPERQVEKVVETGLLWDNAIGGGFFGFLQPLLHPLEALRSFTKTATGSSDQLSSRRIALYHLRESLKDIYTGEIMLLGDADIRPHDLLYIGDIYERMYGMVEIEQVVHHFTPETGFITAVTPNALVSVNDPVRWSLLSYMWSKMSNYNIRDDMRALMQIKSDRAVANATKEITSEDIFKNFSTQMVGAMQWTQGSSALIRDIGAVFTGGGVKSLSAADERINQIGKIDMTLGLLKSGATVLGGAVGTFAAGPGGTVGGAVAGWAVTDLIWEAWQWVKDNLLDQHGCYIQYLNKDGQPMDAGLSYYQGTAVGTNHTLKLFPQILGTTGSVNVRENGHYRITTNDILASLGYSEVETISLHRDTSMYVNQLNADILKISGRGGIAINSDDFTVLKAQVLSPEGEPISGGGSQSGIEDGDTLHVRIVDGGGVYPNGEIIRIRLSVVNTYELQYHNDPYTDINELLMNPSNDLGRLATQYLINRFSRDSDRVVAIRVDKRNMVDTYGRTIGMVFHNTPISTPLSQRMDTLFNYASQYPPVSFDSYLPDGRPYTLNWEMVMTGYGQVDMRESLWDTQWRTSALNKG